MALGTEIPSSTKSYPCSQVRPGPTTPIRTSLPTSAALFQGSELASNANGCLGTGRHLQTTADMGLKPKDSHREEHSEEWNQGARSCNAWHVCSPLPPLSLAAEFTHSKDNLVKPAQCCQPHTKLLVKCFHQNQSEKVQSKHHQLVAGMNRSCQRIW